MSERTNATDAPHEATELQRTMIEWLEAEFPGWTVTVAAGSDLEGRSRPLWIARRPGHHPQAELTPAKLHTRLTEYLEREGQHLTG